MPSLTSPVTSASCESRLVGTSHESPVKGPNSFRFTHFRKNASASPLESHTFKTKDLKPFRFTHFQKSGRGRGCLGVSLSDFVLLISYLRFSLTPLDSALTSKRAPKPFRCNTYEKHTQGEGGCPKGPVIPTGHLPRAERAICAPDGFAERGASGGISLRLVVSDHESRITSHVLNGVNYSHACQAHRH